MKKKEIIKQIIRDFHLSEKFAVISRDIELPVDSGKIITIIGVRRCGKTSLLYELINTLSDTINKEQILYFNFEDERLDFQADELDLLLHAYSELYPQYDIAQCYFFFDEIQNIPQWETFIRRIYDTKTKNLFITGSNSKLLSSEIATSLRGRTLNYEIYPLSFNEFLRFKEIKPDFYSTKQLAYIKNAQDQFLSEGGFPELVFINKEYALPVLQEYYNVLIYKDIVERYQVKNTVALKYFLKRVLNSTTKQISVNKIYNELKSAGIKTGKNSLYDFLDYCQNIYLSLVLNKYDKSLVNKELGEKKVYSIDIGFNNAIEYKFSEDKGKSLENAVFLELKRQRISVLYYKTDKSECDFICFDREKAIIAIQVTYDMSNEKTRQREINGLLNACQHFSLKSGIIITYEDEDELSIDNIHIKLIPFFKMADRFKMQNICEKSSQKWLFGLKQSRQLY